MLIAVTDHAAERYGQRVGGALDLKLEVARRAGEAVQAGRIAEAPPAGTRGRSGTVYVTDARDRSLIYVCRRTGPAELLVVTLWEHERGPAAPRVPRHFTDALDRGARPAPRPYGWGPPAKRADRELSGDGIP